MLPPIKEIRAVQKVLYDPARLEKLSALMCDIATLMNLVPPGTGCGGLIVKNPPADYGKGPTWYLLRDGAPALNGDIAQAADRCDRVAALILQMHAALAHVHVRASAKADLRTGLAELASSWRTRGALWRDPDPKNGDAQVKTISGHFRTSMQAFEHVRLYL